jgi:hypothetical protein
MIVVGIIICATNAIQGNPIARLKRILVRHTPIIIPVIILELIKEIIKWVMTNSFPLYLLSYDARKILGINVLSTKRINNDIVHAKQYFKSPAHHCAPSTFALKKGIEPRLS